MSMRREAPDKQRAFYKSKEWQRCRAEYVAKVSGLCERCEAKGIIKPGKIVHHKEYIDICNINDPEILLNHDNLEMLCIECHNAEHFTSKRRYTVGADGSVSVTHPPYVAL